MSDLLLISAMVFLNLFLLVCIVGTVLFFISEIKDNNKERKAYVQAKKELLNRYKEQYGAVEGTKKFLKELKSYI